MTLATAERAAIEASLTQAGAAAGDLTAAVYARLFARHPAMEAEFWRDRSGAIRGEMLARTFESILDMAGDRSFVDAYIGTEIVTHDAYGIPRAVFAEFFGIVAAEVAAACGPDWTTAMAAAWAGLLADIAAVLAAVPGSDGPALVHDVGDIVPADRGLVFPAR